MLSKSIFRPLTISTLSILQSAVNTIPQNSHWYTYTNLSKENYNNNQSDAYQLHPHVWVRRPGSDKCHTTLPLTYGVSLVPKRGWFIQQLRVYCHGREDAWCRCYRSCESRGVRYTCICISLEVWNLCSNVLRLLCFDIGCFLCWMSMFRRGRSIWRLLLIRISELLFSPTLGSFFLCGCWDSV